MPNTTYFTQNYVTPFDPAYVDLWGAEINALHVLWDSVAGRLQFPLAIQAPADGTYRLVTNSRFPFTVDQMTVETDAGTVTCNLKIETTSITSLDAVSASTTEATASATGANTLSIGENLNLTLSSASGVGWLYVNVWCDRTAAGTA